MSHVPDKSTANDNPAPLSAAFDRVRVINLSRRVDRRRETTRELTTLGEVIDGHRIDFFPALEPEDANGFPSPGVRGCYQSHLAVLEAAARDGITRLLVMEDDVAFVRDAGGLLPALTQQLETLDWDIAYLGHAMERVQGAPQWLPVTGPMRYAHCYTINGRTLGRLVTFLKEIMARDPGHPDGGPMHFDGALSTFIAKNADVRALYASRNLVYQRPSRTDLHRQSVIDRYPLLREFATPLRAVKRLYLASVR